MILVTPVKKTVPNEWRSSFCTERLAQLLDGRMILAISSGDDNFVSVGAPNDKPPNATAHGFNDFRMAWPTIAGLKSRGITRTVFVPNVRAFCLFLMKRGTPTLPNARNIEFTPPGIMAWRG